MEELYTTEASRLDDCSTNEIGNEGKDKERGRVRKDCHVIGIFELIASCQQTVERCSEGFPQRCQLRWNPIVLICQGVPLFPSCCLADNQAFVL